MKFTLLKSAAGRSRPGLLLAAILFMVLNAIGMVVADPVPQDLAFEYASRLSAVDRKDLMIRAVECSGWLFGATASFELWSRKDPERAIIVRFIRPLHFLPWMPSEFNEVPRVAGL
jgi:hypothetical protein